MCGWMTRPNNVSRTPRRTCCAWSSGSPPCDFSALAALLRDGTCLCLCLRTSGVLDGDVTAETEKRWRRPCAVRAPPGLVYPRDWRAVRWHSCVHSTRCCTPSRQSRTWYAGALGRLFLLCRLTLSCLSPPTHVHYQVPYLIDVKNFSPDAVWNDIFPIFTYSYFAFTLLAAPATQARASHCSITNVFCFLTPRAVHRCSAARLALSLAHSLVFPLACSCSTAPAWPACRSCRSHTGQVSPLKWCSVHMSSHGWCAARSAGFYRRALPLLCSHLTHMCASLF